MQVGVFVDEQKFLSHTALNPRVKFLCFGDSITQNGSDTSLGGWTTLLNDAYTRRVDVINRGLSGYNSSWAIEALPFIISEWSSNPPSLVTLFFGANDAALVNGNCKKQHVPVPLYKNNLKTIVTKLREAFSDCKVIVIAPPPVNEDVRDARCNEQTKQYADACVEIAAEMSTGIINTFSEFQKQGGQWATELLNDGLHFSAAGNMLLYKLLQAEIDAAYPDLSIDAIPRQFPDHKMVDAENPKTSFSK